MITCLSVGTYYQHVQHIVGSVGTYYQHVFFSVVTLQCDFVAEMLRFMQQSLTTSPQHPLSLLLLFSSQAQVVEIFRNSFQVARNIKSSNFNLVCSESVTFTVITYPAFSAWVPFRNVAGDATVSVFQNAEQAVSDNLYLSL